MIRIVLNGIDLDTEQTTLRWESVNSLFTDDLQGDYSFPFMLSLSATNMKALGFAHLADVPTRSVAFPVLLILDNTSMNSTLIINGTTSKGFNVNIAGGIKGLVNAEKNLKDLTYYIASTGNGTIDLHSSFGNMALYQYVNWKLAIAFPPHYNPDFYGDSNPDFQGVINRMDATVGNFKLNTPGSGNDYCLVPFVYIHYILKTIADENGLTLAGSYYVNTEISSALLYNNYALDKELDVGCVVKQSLPQIMSFIWDQDHGPDPNYLQYILLNLIDSLPGCSNDAGNWNNVNHALTVSTSGDYAIRLDLKAAADFTQEGFGRLRIQINGVSLFEEEIFYVASGTTTDAVLLIATPANAGDVITAHVGNYNDDLELVYNNFTIVSATLKIAKYSEPPVNIMDPIVQIKNHVPDITVEEFLHKIKNWAQVEITPDWANRKLIMNFAETIIAEAPQIDLTLLADPDYEQIFEEKSKGYTLKYDFGSQDALITDNFKAIDPDLFVGEFDTPDDLPDPSFLGYFAVVRNSNKVYRAEIDGTLQWVEYCDYYYPVVEGKGTTERTVELAPMMMTTAATNESATANADHMKCLMPTIRETGSSTVFGLGMNDASLRVVFMRGKNQTEAVGGKYIYASPTNIDINGNIVGEYTLKLQGTDSWYERYLQKILLAIDNSAVFEFTILLPASYLQYKGKVSIRYVNYLVKNVSMPIGAMIRKSVVQLLKL